MKLDEVIRKYRKEKQLTQEEMAGYLGVSGSAVNKWENGNCYPDIALLAPIARLLGISTDTLLSYKEELSSEEIAGIIGEIGARLKKEEYDTVFQWAYEKIQEYPTCTMLIYQVSQVLDGYRAVLGIAEPEHYDERLYELYTRALDSADHGVSQGAAIALFHLCLNGKEYEKAQEYLNRLPERGMHPKQLQAVLYHRQGKKEEAYKLYEQILFMGYSDLLGAFNGILGLAMAEKDYAKAGKIVEKQKALAALLEMGKYMEVSPGLDLAIARQDKEETLKIIADIVHSMKEMDSFKKSELYSHMEFSAGGTGEIEYMLQRGFENDESIDFLKADERYARLMEELKSRRCVGKERGGQK